MAYFGSGDGRRHGRRGQRALSAAPRRASWAHLDSGARGQVADERLAPDTTDTMFGVAETTVGAALHVRPSDEYRKPGGHALAALHGADLPTEAGHEATVPTNEGQPNKGMKLTKLSAAPEHGRRAWLR